MLLRDVYYPSFPDEIFYFKNEIAFLTKLISTKRKHIYFKFYIYLEVAFISPVIYGKTFEQGIVNELIKGGKYMITTYKIYNELKIGILLEKEYSITPSIL